MDRLPTLIAPENLARMYLMAQEAPAGDFIEVGVYKGGSAEVLYDLCMEQDRKLWLYDTFSGIPFKDEIDLLEVGNFVDGMSFEEAEGEFPKARVQKGIFPGELILPEKIAFAHLDVDQYRSYKESLLKILPRMVQGGTILCDDYGLPGCKKAVDEIFWKKDYLKDGRVVFQC